MSFCKFLLCIVFLLTTVAGFIYGGEYLWSGFIFILIVGFLGDGFLPQDTSETDKYRHTWFANLILYFHLPLVLLINIIFAFKIVEPTVNLTKYIPEAYSLASHFFL